MNEYVCDGTSSSSHFLLMCLMKYCFVFGKVESVVILLFDMNFKMNSWVEAWLEVGGFKLDLGSSKGWPRLGLSVAIKLNAILFFPESFPNLTVLLYKIPFLLYVPLLVCGVVLAYLPRVRVNA